MASVTPEERTEITTRQALIAQHQRTAELLGSELRLFFNHLLTEKGLDPSKQYSLSEDGELTEVSGG